MHIDGDMRREESALCAAHARGGAVPGARRQRRARTMQATSPPRQPRHRPLAAGAECAANVRGHQRPARWAIQACPPTWSEHVSRWRADSKVRVSIVRFVERNTRQKTGALHQRGTQDTKQGACICSPAPDHGRARARRRAHSQLAPALDGGGEVGRHVEHERKRDGVLDLGRDLRRANAAKSATTPQPLCAD